MKDFFFALFLVMVVFGTGCGLGFIVKAVIKALTRTSANPRHDGISESSTDDVFVAGCGRGGSGPDACT